MMHVKMSSTLDDLHIDLPSAVLSRLQAIPMLTEANILAVYFDWNNELRALLADLGLTIVLTQIENIPEYMLPDGITHPRDPDRRGLKHKIAVLRGTELPYYGNKTDKEDIVKYILMQRIGEDLKQTWRQLLIKNWPKARLVYYSLDDMWVAA